jgi:hypothetical protein
MAFGKSVIPSPFSAQKAVCLYFINFSWHFELLLGHGGSQQEKEIKNT